MNQVFLHQPFGDPQGLGELMARHRAVSQEVNNALAHGPFRRQHGAMVSTRVEKIQIAVPGFMGNHLKLSELTESSWLHSSVLSVKMPPRIDRQITINQVGWTIVFPNRKIQPSVR